MSFEHLLTPGRLGGLDLPNRLVMPAMDMNQSDEGEVTDPEIRHYAARAAGGVGLVIMGTGAVAWPVGATSRHQPAFSDDRFVPGLARLADAVHDAGGRVCAQLCHHGKTAGVDTAEGRPLLVPSRPTGRPDLSALRDCTPEELMAMATATAGRSPSFRVAEPDDLAWVVDQFAQAAVRAREAGLDAVEIHAAHGYLLSTFLSAGYNQRDDDWGGSLANRARLTCDVIRAVRAAVGPAFPVLVRVNGHEYGIHGGLTAPEVAEAASHFEAAGADAIHVSANAHNAFADFTKGPLPSAVGQYRAFARTVRAAVGVPVIGVGRLLPEVAEEAIAEGDLDFAAMGRQLLADPELPAKLAAGRRASVRPCINCYVCVAQNFSDDTPRCAVNPALGAEYLATFPPAGRLRRVVVVGGGPGGMEVARVAARRGHLVTLLEASDRLGGTAWFSQLTTPANAQLVEWLEHEIADAGVTVRLRSEATVERLRALRPDVVVVATGARRGRPDVPGAELPHVRTGDDLRSLLAGGGPVTGMGGATGLAIRAATRLGVTRDADRVRRLSERWLPLGHEVVVVGGGLVGLELAEFLAERGRRVTVLEAGPVMGLPMALPRRWEAVARAAGRGVDLQRSAEVVEITPGSVRYRTTNADGQAHDREVPATDVVIASEVSAGAPLADELRAAGFDVRVVGDAVTVGYIEGAVHSADAVARAL